MTSAALRKQIEDVLADRIAQPLTTRERAATEFIRSGVAEADELLRGGLPIGVVTEFTGSESSGRTTLALTYMSAITRTGGVCAWIDVADTLCPESAAASGVDLERLLWVRCGAAAAKPQPVAAAQVTTPEVVSRPVGNGGCGSPHPRSEGRALPEAIGALLEPGVRRQRRAIGTPGAPNRPLAREREEQVATDRLPARRGQNLHLPHLQSAPKPQAMAALPRATASTGATAQAMDQALRAADLLLQGGGFGVIVLDLGSTPAELAWKIPLATWFRFRAACERTRVSVLVLTQHPCARSAAELVVRMGAAELTTDGLVVTGAKFRAEIERSRYAEREAKVVSIRKPPQAERGRWTHLTGAARWA